MAMDEEYASSNRTVPLDRSDDEIVKSQCLEGFRCAIYVTADVSMKTERDAFITSLAKFTSLALLRLSSRKYRSH
ncbi:hypothetical protein ACP70R_012688 [Stipagrostis hirtigluma subsp. patula]